MRRDTDRGRVYAAENAVFDETLFTEPLGAAGVVDLTRLVAADPWWIHNGVPFGVSPARRESLHSSARLVGATGRIRLSLHQEDAATLAHELAHLLAGSHDAGDRHGPLFRTAVVDVTAIVCGAIASDRLARGFAEHGLPCAPRRWEPPVDPGDRGLYGRWRAGRITPETRMTAKRV